MYDDSKAYKKRIFQDFKEFFYKIRGSKQIKLVIIARKPKVQLPSLPSKAFIKNIDLGRFLGLWKQKIHLQGV